MSRVLVVEDETHLAEGLRFNLAAEGYEADVVGDGESATERLLGKRENFDAVVLDIMLPGKDGFHVVSELRAARNYVPVLMLTARGRPEDVLKGFASGADDYLAKPFDLSILLARLQMQRDEGIRIVIKGVIVLKKKHPTWDASHINAALPIIVANLSNLRGIGLNCRQIIGEIRFQSGVFRH